jgi:alanine racemase
MSTVQKGPPGLETGSRLTIDLSAIAANYKYLAGRAAPAECAAVVKADAYGLGAPIVAKALWDAGARTFFTAHVFEARAVRTALPEAVLYVLGGLNPGAASILAEIKARPVLGSPGEIEEWRTYGNGAPAAIHVDTGMNRLGLSLSEAEDIAQRGLGFTPSLVMSHLACADEPDHPLNKEQVTAFEAVRALFPGIPASLANSAATIIGGDYRYDLCRPGIALYGGNPFYPRPTPELSAVARIEAKIVQLRTAGRGEKVGYGATETLRRPSTLAILSLGYADGFLRAAGSGDGHKGAEVIIAGKRCPLVGRVSMDLIAADITDLKDGAVQRGDFATVLGDGINVDDLARRAGTIGYEILTRLGPRFERLYAG